MRRRMTGFAAVVLAVTLLGAACGGGDEDEPEAEPKQEKKEAPEPTAPLTGLPDPDGTAASRQAMFVKIDNADFEGTRPQAGLELADVVYEEVVEYNITRFNAVFNSQVPEPVGPIRSVRAMDSDIVWPLGGTFVFSGGTPANVDLISQAPVTVVDENNAGEAFYRYDQKDAPHNLYGHGQALLDFGGQPVPPPSLFKYIGVGKQFEGDEPVGSFTVGFAAGYAPTYTWDDQSGTWKRDIEGAPFVMENGTQIAPTNVIVQFIQYGPNGGEGTIVGEGDAWVFSNGQLTRGRWVRPAREQVTRFVDAAGREIKLTPGTTWVELLPIGALVAVQPPAAPPTG